MQQLRTRAVAASPRKTPMAQVRFEPVIHLVSGDIVNLVAETPKRYEERASFGKTGLMAECISPALWLAGQLEEIGRELSSNGLLPRPIIVQAPIAAMMHPDTPMACEAAVARTRLCPQEFCIEVEDSSLAQSRKDVSQSIEALRRRGFRVGINATRSWCTPLDTGLRLMLDMARVNAADLVDDEDLYGRVSAAVACGMSVIVEQANYRDGDDLAALGIELAIRPRADA